MDKVLYKGAPAGWMRGGVIRQTSVDDPLCGSVKNEINGILNFIANFSLYQMVKIVSVDTASCYDAPSQLYPVFNTVIFFLILKRIYPFDTTRFQRPFLKNGKVFELIDIKRKLKCGCFRQIS